MFLGVKYRQQRLRTARFTDDGWDARLLFGFNEMRDDVVDLELSYCNREKACAY